MSARRRVLVIPSWYPSEAEPTAGIFILQQVRALAAVADVAVLHVAGGSSAFGPAVAVEDGVTVVRMGIDATGAFRRFVGYRAAGRTGFKAVLAEWGRPDIVHVQALFPAALVARDIKRRKGIQYIVTEHSEEYLAASKRRLVSTPGTLSLLLRPLARGAARTVVVSRFLGDRLAELGLADKQPVVIPNVVPVSHATPLPFSAPHMIAHVSVMSPAKNLGMLLAAVDLLRARRQDFILRLVGDGECRAELEDEVTARDLGDFVEFTGRKSVDEVHSILGTSAFSVVSSTHETFSVSAAESLMCGRPVLSTRCGGPEEFVSAENGMLIASDDAQAMADGLYRMLDDFSEFSPDALHEYARARFAPEVVAARILDVYSEVLGG